MASLTLHARIRQNMTNEERHRPSFGCHANAVNLNIGVINGREKDMIFYSVAPVGSVSDTDKRSVATSPGFIKATDAAAVTDFGFCKRKRLLL